MICYNSQFNLWDFVVNNIITLSAIIISILALFTAVYGAYLQRKHFRLSVKPLLRIDRNTNHELNELSFVLHSCGVGPAIIIEHKLFFDNIEIKKVDYGSLHKLIIDLEIPVKSVSGGFLLIGDSFPTNETFLLLSFDFDRMVNNNEVEKIKSHFIFQIIYSDIYNKKYKVTL